MRDESNEKLKLPAKYLCKCLSGRAKVSLPMGLHLPLGLKVSIPGGVVSTWKSGV